MKKLVLFATCLLFISGTVFSATGSLFTDRVTFEGTLDPVSILVDDYSPLSGYPDGFDIYSNSDMNGFFGETEYFSTGFNDNNIIFQQQYCAGCNGSYRLDFQNTSVSMSNMGVFGFGIDFRHSQSNTNYYAFVTYGDGSTENFLIPFGESFFGLTSTDLIATVHLGLVDGGSTTMGSFAQDNLTIGMARPIPTMGEWGLFILGLCLTSLAVVSIRQHFVSVS